MSIGPYASSIRVLIFASLINPTVVRGDTRTEWCGLGRRNIDVIFVDTGAAEPTSVRVSSDILTSLVGTAVAVISTDGE